ncbi:hypothetical protein D9C73_027938 [Collichthys lucidus]|uniref:Uncharacterized protein n=1 Tax=Collichthys lucidus TaxID=240159 RepID=A0A4U5TY89_COLLU|nr:hypothetical protein D9C73_027938 [Collichthys lucidus]
MVRHSNKTLHLPRLCSVEILFVTPNVVEKLLKSKVNGEAKREQLRQEGVPGITDTLVDQHITKDELALHCRRQTRGERQTVVLIEQLLNELMGAKGRDFLGVPLLDQERMQHIWQVQQRHVKCIQDEPGTSANSLNFQLYLLEGLNRWNQDREAASLAVKPAPLLSYSGDLVHCVNALSVKVFGRHIVPSFQPPAVYTGELLGIDYLYSQTGKALQDVHPDSEETEALLEDVGTEEELEDEGFEDSGLDPTVELLDLSDPAPVTTSSSTTPTPTSLQPSPGPAVSTLTAPEQQLAQLSSGQSASITTAASALPLSTAFPMTAPAAAAAATAGSGMATATPADPEKQLIEHTLSSGPTAVPPPPPPPPPPLNILPATLSTATVGPSGAPTLAAAPVQQGAVDERGIPGMDRVDSLAGYLVGLRTETGQTMTNQQASTIIALWQNLLPYDQQRVAYAARHQVRLTTGRFRCSKKRPEFTPGVESTTRCVLASSGSPAQWPDCSRLVESICVKLCNIHKSPKKQGSYSLTRWTLILTDYSKIRQLVLGNATVMQSTTLQLFEINQTTLTQWHNKRLKRQDSRILLQGVNLPDSVPVAARPLPLVQVRPPALPPRPGPQHQYHLPRSTVGQAVDKRKSAAQRQLFCQLAGKGVLFSPRFSSCKEDFFNTLKYERDVTSHKSNMGCWLNSSTGLMPDFSKSRVSTTSNAVWTVEPPQLCQTLKYERDITSYKSNMGCWLNSSTGLMPDFSKSRVSTTSNAVWTVEPPQLCQTLKYERDITSYKSNMGCWLNSSTGLMPDFSKSRVSTTSNAVWTVEPPQLCQTLKYKRDVTSHKSNMGCWLNSSTGLMPDFSKSRVSTTSNAVWTLEPPQLCQTLKYKRDITSHKSNMGCWLNSSTGLMPDFSKSRVSTTSNAVWTVEPPQLCQTLKYKRDVTSHKSNMGCWLNSSTGLMPDFSKSRVSTTSNAVWTLEPPQLCQTLKYKRDITSHKSNMGCWLNSSTGLMPDFSKSRVSTTSNAVWTVEPPQLCQTLKYKRDITSHKSNMGCWLNSSTGLMPDFSKSRVSTTSNAVWTVEPPQLCQTLKYKRDVTSHKSNMGCWLNSSTGLMPDFSKSRVSTTSNAVWTVEPPQLCQTLKYEIDITSHKSNMGCWLNSSTGLMPDFSKSRVSTTSNAVWTVEPPQLCQTLKYERDITSYKSNMRCWLNSSTGLMPDFSKSRVSTTSNAVWTVEPPQLCQTLRYERDITSHKSNMECWLNSSTGLMPDFSKSRVSTTSNAVWTVEPPQLCQTLKYEIDITSHKSNMGCWLNSSTGLMPDFSKSRVSTTSNAVWTVEPPQLCQTLKYERDITSYKSNMGCWLNSSTGLMPDFSKSRVSTTSNAVWTVEPPQLCQTLKYEIDITSHKSNMGCWLNSSTGLMPDFSKSRVSTTSNAVWTLEPPQLCQTLKYERDITSYKSNMGCWLNSSTGLMPDFSKSRVSTTSNAVWTVEPPQLCQTLKYEIDITSHKSNMGCWLNSSTGLMPDFSKFRVSTTSNAVWTLEPPQLCQTLKYERDITSYKSNMGCWLNSSTGLMPDFSKSRVSTTSNAVWTVEPPQLCQTKTLKYEIDITSHKSNMGCWLNSSTGLMPDFSKFRGFDNKQRCLDTGAATIVSDFEVRERYNQHKSNMGCWLNSSTGLMPDFSKSRVSTTSNAVWTVEPPQLCQTLKYERDITSHKSNMGCWLNSSTGLMPDFSKSRVSTTSNAVWTVEPPQLCQTLKYEIDITSHKSNMGCWLNSSTGLMPDFSKSRVSTTSNAVWTVELPPMYFEYERDITSHKSNMGCWLNSSTGLMPDFSNPGFDNKQRCLDCGAATIVSDFEVRDRYNQHKSNMGCWLNSSTGLMPDFSKSRFRQQATLSGLWSRHNCVRWLLLKDFEVRDRYNQPQEQYGMLAQLVHWVDARFSKSRVSTTSNAVWTVEPPQLCQTLKYEIDITSHKSNMGCWLNSSTGLMPDFSKSRVSTTSNAVWTVEPPQLCQTLKYDRYNQPQEQYGMLAHSSTGLMPDFSKSRVSTTSNAVWTVEPPQLCQTLKYEIDITSHKSNMGCWLNSSTGLMPDFSKSRVSTTSNAVWTVEPPQLCQTLRYEIDITSHKSNMGCWLTVHWVDARFEQIPGFDNKQRCLDCGAATIVSDLKYERDITSPKSNMGCWLNSSTGLMPDFSKSRVSTTSTLSGLWSRHNCVRSTGRKRGAVQSSYQGFLVAKKTFFNTLRYEIDITSHKSNMGCWLNSSTGLMPDFSKSRVSTTSNAVWTVEPATIVSDFEVRDRYNQPQEQYGCWLNSSTGLMQIEQIPGFDNKQRCLDCGAATIVSGQLARKGVLFILIPRFSSCKEAFFNTLKYEIDITSHKSNMGCWLNSSTGLMPDFSKSRVSTTSNAVWTVEPPQLCQTLKYEIDITSYKSNMGCWLNSSTGLMPDFSKSRVSTTSNAVWTVEPPQLCQTLKYERDITSHKSNMGCWLNSSTGLMPDFSKSRVSTTSNAVWTVEPPQLCQTLKYEIDITSHKSNMGCWLNSSTGLMPDFSKSRVSTTSNAVWTVEPPQLCQTLKYERDITSHKSNMGCWLNSSTGLMPDFSKSRVSTTSNAVWTVEPPQLCQTLKYEIDITSHKSNMGCWLNSSTGLMPDFSKSRVSTTSNAVWTVEPPQLCQTLKYERYNQPQEQMGCWLNSSTGLMPDFSKSRVSTTSNAVWTVEPPQLCQTLKYEIDITSHKSNMGCWLNSSTGLMPDFSKSRVSTTSNAVWTVEPPQLCQILANPGFRQQARCLDCGAATIVSDFEVRDRYNQLQEQYGMLAQLVHWVDARFEQIPGFDNKQRCLDCGAATIVSDFEVRDRYNQLQEQYGMLAQLVHWVDARFEQIPGFDNKQRCLDCGAATIVSAQLESVRLNEDLKVPGSIPGLATSNAVWTVEPPQLCQTLKYERDNQPQEQMGCWLNSSTGLMPDFSKSRVSTKQRCLDCGAATIVSDFEVREDITSHKSNMGCWLNSSTGLMPDFSKSRVSTTSNAVWTVEPPQLCQTLKYERDITSHKSNMGCWLNSATGLMPDFSKNKLRSLVKRPQYGILSLLVTGLHEALWKWLRFYPYSCFCLEKISGSVIQSLDSSDDFEVRDRYNQPQEQYGCWLNSSTGLMPDFSKSRVSTTSNAVWTVEPPQLCQTLKYEEINQHKSNMGCWLNSSTGLMPDFSKSRVSTTSNAVWTVEPPQLCQYCRTVMWRSL